MRRTRYFTLGSLILTTSLMMAQSHALAPPSNQVMQGHEGRTRGSVWNSSATGLVVSELRRLCSNLLLTDRCTALLLLLHGRSHCDGIPVAVERRSGTLRSHDHRLQ